MQIVYSKSHLDII